MKRQMMSVGAWKCCKSNFMYKSAETLVNHPATARVDLTPAMSKKILEIFNNASALLNDTYRFKRGIFGANGAVVSKNGFSPLSLDGNIFYLSIARAIISVLSSSLDESGLSLYEHVLNNEVVAVSEAQYVRSSLSDSFAQILQQLWSHRDLLTRDEKVISENEVENLKILVDKFVATKTVPTFDNKATVTTPAVFAIAAYREVARVTKLLFNESPTDKYLFTLRVKTLRLPEFCNDMKEADKKNLELAYFEDRLSGCIFDKRWLKGVDAKEVVKPSSRGWLIQPSFFKNINNDLVKTFDESVNKASYDYYRFQTLKANASIFYKAKLVLALSCAEDVNVSFTDNDRLFNLYLNSTDDVTMKLSDARKWYEIYKSDGDEFAASFGEFLAGLYQKTDGFQHHFTGFIKRGEAFDVIRTLAKITGSPIAHSSGIYSYYTGLDGQPSRLKYEGISRVESLGAGNANLPSIEFSVLDEIESSKPYPQAYKAFIKDDAWIDRAAKHVSTTGLTVIGDLAEFYDYLFALSLTAVNVGETGVGSDSAEVSVSFMSMLAQLTPPALSRDHKYDFTYTVGAGSTYRVAAGRTTYLAQLSVRTKANKKTFLTALDKIDISDQLFLTEARFGNSNISNDECCAAYGALIENFFACPRTKVVDDDVFEKLFSEEVIYNYYTFNMLVQWLTDANPTMSRLAFSTRTLPQDDSKLQSDPMLLLPRFKELQGKYEFDYEVNEELLDDDALAELADKGRFTIGRLTTTGVTLEFSKHSNSEQNDFGTAHLHVVIDPRLGLNFVTSLANPIGTKIGSNPVVELSYASQIIADNISKGRKIVAVFDGSIVDWHSFVNPFEDEFNESWKGKLHALLTSLVRHAGYYVAHEKLANAEYVDAIKALSICVGRALYVTGQSYLISVGGDQLNNGRSVTLGEVARLLLPLTSIKVGDDLSQLRADFEKLFSLFNAVDVSSAYRGLMGYTYKKPTGINYTVDFIDTLFGDVSKFIKLDNVVESVNIPVNERRISRVADILQQILLADLNDLILRSW